MYISTVTFLASLASCGLFYFFQRDSAKSKDILWLIYLTIFGFAAYLFFSKVIYRMQHAEVWDFTAFFLYGKVAASGLDFYKPENFHQVFDSLRLSLPDNSFVREVVDVGFPYPPQTILYFVPLGFMSYNTALVAWTLFNLFFVFACIYLVYDQFFKAHKVNGLVLVATLFFILSPGRETVLYSQTNFILLFYLLLIRKYSDNKIAGVFLALAIFTKPYMAILGLYFLFKKKWSAITYFIVSSAVITGLVFIFFGMQPFISYVLDNPSHRIPTFVFSEDVNQSLHATLLRLNIVSLEGPSYLYILAGILCITGIYSIFLARRRQYDYLLALLLLVGLLLYPGTVSGYGVVLLFIVFQFFGEDQQAKFNPYLTALLIGLFYLLSTFSVFLSICFLIAIITAKSLKPTKLPVPVPV